jgi:hypothetical protein
MIATWTSLPSGAEVKRSVRMVRPAEGALTSVSQLSKRPVMAASAASACGVLASAIRASRLAMSPTGGRSGQANRAFSRGSMRGSRMSLEVTTSFMVCTPEAACRA